MIGGRARAFFTTRQGGVSRGPYGSLNLAAGLGDAAGAVAENRRRVARVLGLSPAYLVEAQQVHGRRAAVVGPRQAGRVVPGVDGLVTRSAAVWLAVYTADCIPVLLLDPLSSAAGVVHAGWRGVAAGVVETTLARMVDAAGAAPQRMRAAIGPAIGGCCYEVDAPVASAMAGAPWWSEAARPGARPGRWYLDLRTAVRRQIEAFGVPPSAIEVIPGCTRCQPDLFFSYRREQTTGRMGACIRLCDPADRAIDPGGTGDTRR